jgi:hypothetical protein
MARVAKACLVSPLEQGAVRLQTVHHRCRRPCAPPKPPRLPLDVRSVSSAGFSA